jgi:branched-chain amino acid transport system substrate-binding protein
MFLKSVLLCCTLALLLLMPAMAFCQEPVKVGIILPTTGEKAKFGEIEKKSFEMALAEINANGGINGRKLSFLFEDDTGRPDVARSAAEKLITRDNVVMLGGGYGSSETFAIAGVAQQNRIPFLINTGSDNKITEMKWNYVFRLNQPVSDYPKALETFLTDVVKAKSVAILYENTNFGSSGSREFQDSCKKLNLKVLLNEGYQSGGVDFKPLLVRVKEANPDIVYMISYLMDASLLMQQSMELKLSPKLFVGGGAGFTLPEFCENAGKAANMVYSATLWYQTLPYPGAKLFYDKFLNLNQMPAEYHGAEAYSAAYVIADALKRAKSTGRDDVRESLAGTDLMTVFGPVRFIAYEKMSNQNKLPSYLVQWMDGKLELVWPEGIATKPFAYPVNWEQVWK